MGDRDERWGARRGHISRANTFFRKQIHRLEGEYGMGMAQTLWSTMVKTNLYITNKYCKTFTLDLQYSYPLGLSPLAPRLVRLTSSGGCATIGDAVAAPHEAC